MAVTIGVILLVIGLIVLTHAVSLPASWESHISHHSLGWILVVVGIIALVVGLLEARARRRRFDALITRDHDIDAL